VFWRLLQLCPTPEAAVAADTDAIRDIIAPLGLHNKRAVAVQRLSQDFLQKEVRNRHQPYQLIRLPSSP
jgi:methyl-CpG-binding domain protein 4